MLSALIWLPALGATLIGFWPRAISASRTRFLALAVASGLIFWNIILLSQFDINNVEMQMSEFIPWIEPLGLDYSIGVDGLSIPLVALTGLLTWIAIYSSPESVARPRLYYALILLVNAGMAGGFLAQNLLLFFLFYELELIPLLPINRHLGWVQAWLRIDKVSTVYGSFGDFNPSSILGHDLARWFYHF